MASGTSGDDFLDGGTGDDTLKGGSDNDTINKFTASAASEDAILPRNTGIANIASMLAFIVNDGDGNAILTPASGDTLIPLHVIKDQFNADDFRIANEGAPAGIALDNLSIDENFQGAVIGALGVGDPDAGDIHVFAVDDAFFEVIGGTLKLVDGVSLYHAPEPSVTVVVTATELGGPSVSESFAIAVGETSAAPAAESVRWTQPCWPRRARRSCPRLCGRRSRTPRR